MSGSNECNQKLSKIYNRTKHAFTLAEGGQGVAEGYSCTFVELLKVLQLSLRSAEGYSCTLPKGHKVHHG